MKKITGLMIAGSVLFASTAALSDDDNGWLGWIGKSRPGVAPVTESLYREECGACHFAYQPGLLPARSWEKMMLQLDDHFGEYATLASEERKAITAYLVVNAADRAEERRSRRMARSVGADETPLRITETRYFRGEHDELSRSLLEENPEVGSFSRCPACHSRADAGSYREGEIRIPGVGKWDD